MRESQGNVRQEEKKPERPPEEFKSGDIVALTDRAIKKGPRLMSPKRLYSVGWPNEFQVVHVFETPEDGVCLFLNPCCQNLVKRNGAWACQGHPVVFEGTQMFQKTTPEVAKRPRRQGDRTTSIVAPVVGELGAIEYLEDENDPGLVLRILGQQTVLKGSVAKSVAKFAQDNGLL
jgi:hypothetical protein